MIFAIRNKSEHIKDFPKLNWNQNAKAYVRTDVFKVKLSRGKIGNSLSSNLFNNILEEIFWDLIPTWVIKEYRVKINSKYLNLLRFANDVMLTG